VITVTVDPFHVAPSVAADVVAAGSYTGNGATNRTIPLAFTPKWVVVVCETASTPMYVSDIAASTYGWQIGHNVTPARGSAIATNVYPKVTTNGFVVSGNAANDVNQNARVFHYLAFG
jgi:hypothetical protein